MDFLYRIVYSLSYGEVPRVRVASTYGNYEGYMLGTDRRPDFTAADFFDGFHLKPDYRDYMLNLLSPALRLCETADLQKLPQVQGTGEYFALRCTDGKEKFFVIAPSASFIHEMTPKLARAIREALHKDSTPQQPAPPPPTSNLSIAQLARQRATQRPYGDVYEQRR